MTSWSGSTRRQWTPPNWEQIRQAVLQRDGYRCQWVDQLGTCGQLATDVDHIRPVSQGGGHNLENLRSLCRWHHNKKSSAEGNAARWRNRNQREPEPHPGLITRPPGG